MILALIVVASAAGSSTATTPTLAEMTHSLDQWFNKHLNQQKAAAVTLTKLQIYIHADFKTDSDNQTVYQVATAKITSQSSSNFGRILVIDNPLTTGPDPGSKFLGRYEGTNAYSDFNEAAANMNMNIIFSGGEYDGSTISILGRQPVNDKVRVLSVIGGTRVFRLAKGVLLASTYSTDPLTQIGTYVYVIYVVTPAVDGRAHTA